MQNMKQKGGTPKFEEVRIQALYDVENKKRGEKRKKNIKKEEREMKGNYNIKRAENRL